MNIKKHAIADMRKVVITLPLENIFRLHYNKGGNIVVFEEAICDMARESPTFVEISENQNFGGKRISCLHYRITYVYM
jgi:hypothetical protein